MTKAPEQPRTSDSPSNQPTDPDASLRMQILSTEHWSLRAARSLTYSEAFSRVAMFISVLSGAMIAIALVTHAERFGSSSIGMNRIRNAYLELHAAALGRMLALWGMKSITGFWKELPPRFPQPPS